MDEWNLEVNSLKLISQLFRAPDNEMSRAKYIGQPFLYCRKRQKKGTDDGYKLKFLSNTISLDTFGLCRHT
jgi:hypothetical protein